jgi:hypothetical protein
MDIHGYMDIPTWIHGYLKGHITNSAYKKKIFSCNFLNIETVVNTKGAISSVVPGTKY